MSISTTVAPFLANSFAADRPMPSPPPVTIATLPLKLAMLLKSFGNCGGAQRRRQPDVSCAFRDDRDHAAAVGPLVLGAAGDEDRGVVDDAGGDRADRRADMPLLVDVAIIEHRMRFAADHAVAGGFAFHKDGPDPRRPFA